MAWSGIGNFVYLADARFVPKGETGMHPHREIDVISVMVEGRIAHGGSLEHGQELNPFDVQVQRAGGEGFSHNETNPDDMLGSVTPKTVLSQLAAPQADIETVTTGPGVIFWSASKSHLTKTTMMKLAKEPIYQQMTIRNHNTVFKLLKLFDEV
jgi:hypothetical protein